MAGRDPRELYVGDVPGLASDARVEPRPTGPWPLGGDQGVRAVDVDLRRDRERSLTMDGGPTT